MLDLLRRARIFQRFFATLLAAVFLFTSVTVVHAQGQAAGAALPQVAPVAAEKLDSIPKLLGHLKEQVAAKHGLVNQRIAEGGVWERVKAFVGASALSLEDVADLESIVAAIDARHSAEVQGFADTKQRLHKLALNEKAKAKFNDRVDHAKRAYLAGYTELQRHMKGLKVSKTLPEQQQALEALDGFFQKQQFSRSQEPFDPNAPLPFGPGEPAKAREPSTALDPVSAMQSPVQRTTERLMSAVGDTLIAPAHAAFVPPGAADLGESDEITLSPAIRAKATELHNNPVEIYNWVRNSVEWIPTYGSLQDADATLASQRGNAFAISSLLIALLRAAGTQARYAYGVIEVPIAQAQNWVGGTTNPGAALSVLYQGGIPNAGVVEGGRISTVRMEHIWVEAYVDFVPSRGAKNVAPDTWVSLDASYKQYDYTTGYDLAQNVPFDTEGLINDLQASATSNATEGWVQNVDPALIQQRFEQYKAQVETYINNQNPEATVGEVLGTRKAIVFAPMQLAAGLPYALQGVTARYSEIPAPLRHGYRLTLSEKTPLAQTTGATVLDVSVPMSVVTRKTLALSFVPATQADEDLLLSYVPSNGSALPTELPGYLIDMKAQITLDGEVVAEGGSFPMGTELSITHYFQDPARDVRPVSSDIIAGEYHAIGVDGGQINVNLLSKTKAQLEQARTELEAIKAQLEANQTPTISAFLTRHTLTGNLLQTGILGYFALNDALDQVDGKGMGVVTQRLPSFGTFATSLEPQYLFGSIPRNVKLAGLAMDVDRISTLAMAKDGKNQTNIMFHRVLGPRLSTFEHLVPEQLFSTPEQPAQAISTVKALAIAASQGQKIYTLTKASAAQLNTLTISQRSKTEIVAALNANKEVTVHQTPISYAGWTGEGYTVIDPTTGAGAYKISGGSNGGVLEGLTFVIYTLSYATDYLDALAEFAGAAVPILASVARFISVAKFTIDVLTQGLACLGPDGSNISAVFVTMALFAILSLLIVQAVQMFFNPLAAFVVNIAVDQATNWLFSQVQNCPAPPDERRQ